jgi:hypothetical protein
MEAPYLEEMSTEPRQLSDSALAAFSRARAVLAVCHAFADDPVEAARDAPYEAQASMQQLKKARP